MENTFLLLPYMLIDLAGLAYAALEWRRHPRLSLLVTVSLAVSLGRMVVVNLILGPAVFGHPGVATKVILTASSLIGAAAQILLLVAAFVGFHEGLVAMERQSTPS
jgi:hypothetical protein